MFCKSARGLGITQKVEHFETILFYMNDSYIHNESFSLLCRLISTLSSATEERKEMFYKDANLL
jgi:hypothetical protein